MTFRNTLGAAMWAVAALLATTANADVTLGTSSNPNISLTERLGPLLGAEKRALDQIDEVSFSALVRAPNRDTSKELKMTRTYLDALPAPSGGAEWKCLSEALYFEARGERIRGIFGVAEVILNRVDDVRYPGTVCDVITQGTGERYRCQFTYTCDGRPETIRDTKAYRLVGKVARIMLDDAPRDLTNGATHYHTKSVNPNWADVFPRTTTIGYHHFYREPNRRVQG